MMLVGSSLATVFFCFVPEWLGAAISSSGAVWRLSLGLYGAYRLAYTGWLLLRGSLPSGRARWATVVSILIAALQLVASAGYLAELRFFLFLSGLLWGLVVALLAFAFILSGSEPE